jgi:hypothetical protein
MEARQRCLGQADGELVEAIQRCMEVILCLQYKGDDARSRPRRSRQRVELGRDAGVIERQEPGAVLGCTGDPDGARRRRRGIGKPTLPDPALKRKAIVRRRLVRCGAHVEAGGVLGDRGK